MASIGQALVDYWRRITYGEQLSFLARMLRGGLWLASFGYGWAVWWRNWAYDRRWLRGQRVGVSVLSVGNLTVGGTGKTPFVAWLAHWLDALGYRVAIVSRGYGARNGLNDEALELAWELPHIPHWQGANRVALAQWAAAQGVEVVILDDGMQHRQLHRDVEIVLVDASDPWGGGYLLPRGRLREPRTALGRADIIVLTRAELVSATVLADLAESTARFAPQALQAIAQHQPRYLTNVAGERQNLDTLAGRKVAAFCGIGHPEAFAAHLRQLGAEIIAWRIFPDHHTYSDTDLNELAQWLARQGEASWVVTTRKDLVKLPQREIAGKPLWALVAGMEIVQGQQALQQRILRVLPAEQRLAA
ncbi:MAG: tetraacyldisaccharide 4'-kinase [Gemmatales bacterium]|nr:tetraacyldisaccharide 4'-kinase [Gemmatales bacterium]MDW7993728.1 tetraacyldisaccharide 4'-kinase [Gemmatales bacterium]